MRILTLSYEFPPLGGGGANVARGLSSEFVRGGHDVDLFTVAGRDLPRDEEMSGVRVHRVPCVRGSVDVSCPNELATYLASAIPAAVRMHGASKALG